MDNSTQNDIKLDLVYMATETILKCITTICSGQGMWLRSRVTVVFDVILRKIFHQFRIFSVTI